MPYTVWYKISHDSYPQCRSSMILMSGLEEDDAQRLAIQFGEELKYILGDDVPVSVWAD